MKYLPSVRVMLDTYSLFRSYGQGRIHSAWLSASVEITARREWLEQTAREECGL